MDEQQLDQLQEGQDRLTAQLIEVGMNRRVVPTATALVANAQRRIVSGFVSMSRAAAGTE